MYAFDRVFEVKHKVGSVEDEHNESETPGDIFDEEAQGAKHIELWEVWRNRVSRVPNSG